MEALRRPIPSIDSSDTAPGEDEEEESFFELELTVGDLYPRICSTPASNDEIITTQLKDKPKGSAFLSSDHFQGKQSADKTQLQFDPKLSIPQSKRKILPVESSVHRPQSPISLLKSAPKFRVFMFRKSSSVSGTEKTDRNEIRHKGRSFFTLRFKLKEIERPSMVKKGTAFCSDSPSPGTSNSKRFSREAIHKYLRPLYVKVSSKRQYGGKTGSGEFSPTASPTTAPSGTRVMSCRHLGKSKSASASAATGVMSPARRDDSLLQQHDGIESAILHCKRSFSSSRDISPLTRSASAHEKSQTLDSGTLQ